MQQKRGGNHWTQIKWTRWRYLKKEYINKKRAKKGGWRGSNRIIWPITKRRKRQAIKATRALGTQKPIQSEMSEIRRNLYLRLRVWACFSNNANWGDTHPMAPGRGVSHKFRSQCSFVDRIRFTVKIGQCYVHLG